MTFLSACQYFKPSAKTEKGRLLAKVGKEELYENEIGKLASNAGKNDSLEIVKGFVQRWVEQQLFMHKAEENLSKDLSDLDKRVEAYRQDLIIYDYESQLIKQKSDTSVTNDEMNKYYNAQQKDFELKGEVYRIKYVQLKKDNPAKAEIAKLLTKASQEDFARLNELCKNQAVHFSVHDSAYQPLNFLLQNFPLSAYDIKVIAGNHQIREVSDDEFTYLLLINETLITGNIAPFNLVKNDIRRILQNKKRIDYIESVYKDLYEEGKTENKFEIFL